jgi:hypothetical protein
MSTTRTTRTVTLWAVGCTLLLACACSGCAGQPVNASEDERVHLTGASSCAGPSGANGDMQRCAGGANEDCVRYDYDAAEQILRLSHLNTAFNCCASIAATGAVEGDAITIREIDELRPPDVQSGAGSSPTATPCPCMCLYQMNLEIEDLSPGEYSINVEQMYLGGGDETHGFTVDLASEGSGEHCVWREDYPWGLY